MSDSSFDALMQELLQMFAVEAADHLQTLTQTLLKLERQPQGDERQELLNAAFRAAHSLKGSARAVELMDIEGIAHDMENILSAARSGKLEFTPDIVDVLLNATDVIQNLVERREVSKEQIQQVRQRLKNVTQPPPQEEKPTKLTPTVSVSAPVDNKLDALMKELVQMFAVEAADHLKTLNKTLLALEKQPEANQRQELLNGAFRAAHSLKGSARAVELTDIERIAHEAETVLSAARAGTLDFTPDAVDVLLQAADLIQHLVDGQSLSAEQIQDMVQRLKTIGEKKAEPPVAAPPVEVAAKPLTEPIKTPEKTEPKKPPVKPSSLSTGATEETIRVSVEKLDDLMAQAGELIVSKISADERHRELRDLRSLMGRWEKVWTETTDLQRRLDRLSREEDHTEWSEMIQFLTLSQRYFAESVERIRALDKAMNADNMRLTLVSGAIQEEIRRVRMLPFETHVSMMQRVVRDVARQCNKNAQLVIHGADVELDKKVLELLKDPLVHLLRNSVDHGIELPEERAARGKSEVGTVTVAVSQRGGNVHITVADDGKGIDPGGIRRSAVKKGLMSEAETENLSDEEAQLLIFNAGFSTKEEVTAFSGRGVGMDVVKSQIEELQGRINLRSTPGRGSEFHLILPISLATIRGLIIRIGLDRYAVPLHSVEKIITILPPKIYKVEGNLMFDYDDEPMMVLHMADVLERPRDELRHDRLPALVVAGGERRMAFLVDDFISEQEMVVKPLGKQLHRVRNVAGATLLGTGQPIVILNITDMIKSAMGGRISRKPIVIERKPEEEKEIPPPRILVVDDSITTRTLERNILMGAGYQVMTANDGVEALALLETEPFDLVVTDIEMPRINGFDLVEWIRQSQVYGQIPVILVTSLESKEHRERGLKVGADAYIVKSGFEQAHLLEVINQYVPWEAPKKSKK